MFFCNENINIWKTFLLLKTFFMTLITRPVTAGAQEGKAPTRKFFAPPGKLCWTLFKTIGHSSKFWAPLGKLFAPPGVPSWLRACW